MEKSILYAKITVSPKIYIFQKFGFIYYIGPLFLSYDNVTNTHLRIM